MSDDKPPMTPEEALAKIKGIIAEGKLTYGSDTLTAEYYDEIRVIYKTLRVIQLGKPPKRGLWTQDGERMGCVLKCLPGTIESPWWDPIKEDYTPELYQVFEQASLELGITITPTTIWEDAGAALRALDPTRVKS